jgi:serine protease
MLKAVVVFSLFWLTSTAQAQERLIVKFRESGFASTATAQQIRQEMARPYSQTRLQSLSEQARLALSYSHPVAQSGAHVLRLPEGSSRSQMQAVIANLKRLPEIAYVEEDARMYRLAAPNDALYNQLWGMKPVTAGSSYGANFENAWALTTGSGVVVAVIDTGILPHPDIGSITLGSQTVTGNLVSAGYDFISDCRVAATCPSSTALGSAGRTPVDNAFDQGDWITAADRNYPPFSTEIALNPFACPVQNSSWHGTHVAGTVAALGNNGAGVIGGAYGAKILPVRALGKCFGYLSDIANGVLWAAGVHGSISNPNPARVINMSLGGSAATCPATMQDAINAVTAAGAIVVAAAGNDNVNVSGYAPSNCSNVIAVTATGQNGKKASYSNFGAGVHVAAPGGDSPIDSGIVSTLNSGTTTYNPAGFNYVGYAGTSMATPHVSAAVALLASNIPSVTTSQARAVLQVTATSFPSGSTCSTAICGAGILNAAGVAAVNNSTPTATPDAVNFSQVPPATSSATQTITITNNNPTLPAVFGTSSVVTPAAHFSVVSNTCSGASVAPAGGTCTVAVRFVAPTTGLVQGGLGLPVTTGSLVSTTVVSLTGTSSQKLSVPSTSVTLASVEVGANATTTMTFTNSSGGSVTLQSASLSPTSIFAITSDSCSNATLTNAATCSVSVRATPATAGAYSGTLTLNTTGTGDTAVDVTLNGTATTPAPVSSGGGGGGSTGLLALLFLLAALALSRRYPALR